MKIAMNQATKQQDGLRTRCCGFEKYLDMYQGRSSPYIGDKLIPPFNRNPYNGAL